MELKKLVLLIANNQFYHCTAWRKKRKEAIKRDNNECQLCRIPGQKARLYVHHIKELKLFPNLALDLGNLQTLCGNCHNEVHDKEEQLNQDKKKKYKNEERW